MVQDAQPQTGVRARSVKRSVFIAASVLGLVHVAGLWFLFGSFCLGEPFDSHVDLIAAR